MDGRNESADLSPISTPPLIPLFWHIQPAHHSFSSSEWKVSSKMWQALFGPDKLQKRARECALVLQQLFKTDV